MSEIICSCGRKFKTKAGLFSHLRVNEDHYNATIGESISEMYARLAREVGSHSLRKTARNE